MKITHVLIYLEYQFRMALEYNEYARAIAVRDAYEIVAERGDTAL